MAQEIIRIKPHHFVDIITSFGRGAREFQPHPYGHAVHTVSQQVLEDPGVLLEIELGIDTICLPCKHNVSGTCQDTIDTSYRPQAPPLKREWNLLIDLRWCQRLGIQQGDALTAHQLCERLASVGQDITYIYAEIPTDRTRDRALHLTKGIHFYQQLSKTGNIAPDSSLSIPQ